MRDIKKAIDQGAQIAAERPGLDLNTSEFAYFLRTFNETAATNGTLQAAMQAIATAYRAGLAVGKRNA